MFANRVLALTALGALLTGLAGCGGDYKITLELEDVINAPVAGDDKSRSPMRLDVVVLEEKEADLYPTIVNRGMSSKAWFDARRGDRSSIAGIPASQVHAFREGSANPSEDTKVGDALVSPVDTNGKREVACEFEPPGGGGVIAIFAGFSDSKGFRPHPPLILSAPGMFSKREARVVVGRTSIDIKR